MTLRRRPSPFLACSVTRGWGAGMILRVEDHVGGPFCVPPLFWRLAGKPPHGGGRRRARLPRPGRQHPPLRPPTNGYRVDPGDERRRHDHALEGADLPWSGLDVAWLGARSASWSGSVVALTMTDPRCSSAASSAVAQFLCPGAGLGWVRRPLVESARGSSQSAERRISPASPHPLALRTTPPAPPPARPSTSAHAPPCRPPRP